MKKAYKQILLVLGTLSFLAAISSCSKPSIKSTAHTTITPHLEEPIPQANNLLYCASFQLAWNKMRDEVFKENLKLDGNPPSAQHLNKRLQDNNDISPESYLAEAGELSKELIERINKELKEKFGEQTAHEFNISQTASSSQQLIAYAFLYKNLEFPTEFDKLKKPITFIANGRETSVKGFGVNSFKYVRTLHQILSSQVAIIDYKNEDDFILSLTTKSANDQLILAKIAPDKTLLQTYAAVIQRIGKVTATELRTDETLQIPKIDFDLSHSFSELENKRIMNKGWEGWSIAKASQDIKFKLDEKGAILESKARIDVIVGFPPFELEKPRKFIFDRPFLICLKQKNSHQPYFALWVNNSELLVGK